MKGCYWLLIVKDIKVIHFIDWETWLRLFCYSIFSDDMGKLNIFQENLIIHRNEYRIYFCDFFEAAGLPTLYPGGSSGRPAVSKNVHNI